MRLNVTVLHRLGPPRVQSRTRPGCWPYRIELARLPLVRWQRRSVLAPHPIPPESLLLDLSPRQTELGPSVAAHWRLAPAIAPVHRSMPGVHWPGESRPVSSLRFRAHLRQSGLHRVKRRSAAWCRCVYWWHIRPHCSSTGPHVDSCRWHTARRLRTVRCVTHCGLRKTPKVAWHSKSPGRICTL